ncbi:MAG: hypothetical protein LAO77_06790 [Acidobacteriia bacterium]|nr:hypothetical protein [Terriglobia bacterium]
MVISNAANAGEIVSADEDTRFYDDLACLARDANAHRDRARAFVRVGGTDWMEAAAAAFAEPANVRTPMGGGVVAFRTSAEARAADRLGRALPWDDVIRTIGERP